MSGQAGRRAQWTRVVNLSIPNAVYYNNEAVAKRNQSAAEKIIAESAAATPMVVSAENPTRIQRAAATPTVVSAENPTRIQRAAAEPEAPTHSQKIQREYNEYTQGCGSVLYARKISDRAAVTASEYCEQMNLIDTVLNLSGATARFSRCGHTYHVVKGTPVEEMILATGADNIVFHHPNEDPLKVAARYPTCTLVESSRGCRLCGKWLAQPACMRERAEMLYAAVNGESPNGSEAWSEKHRDFLEWNGFRIGDEESATSVDPARAAARRAEASSRFYTFLHKEDRNVLSIDEWVAFTSGASSRQEIANARRRKVPQFYWPSS